MRQTALDLLALDYDVHLVVDACSSMNQNDRNIALESMRDMGVSLISFQALMFEMLRTSTSPHFKPILNIVKQAPKEAVDLHYYKETQP